MITTKVLFLDVDGVLNYIGCTAREPCGMMGINDASVAILAKVIRATGAKIVLTSTWRLEWDKNKDNLSETGKYLVRKLKRSWLYIYDKLPDYELGRGEAIKSWLDAHMEIPVESWCVLDDEVADDFERFGILGHLVKTDWENGGIRPEHAEDCIKMLNGLER